MKFKLVFCSIVSFVLMLQACNRCRVYTLCDTEPLILEYFDNYKPGNYWLYENQDGTKKDSIWVSDYKENIQKTNWDADCLRYPQRTFKLHSRYIGLSQTLEAKISNRLVCDSSYFTCKDTLGNSPLFLQYFKLSDYRDDYFLSNVGFKKTISADNKDTFLLIKYYIR